MAVFSNRIVGAAMIRWLVRLFPKKQTEKQLDAELRFHLDQQVVGYVAVGRSPEEARRRARLEFGGLERVKEEVRDTRSAPKLSGGVSSRNPFVLEREVASWSATNSTLGGKLIGEVRKFKTMFSGQHREFDIFYNPSVRIRRGRMGLSQAAQCAAPLRTRASAPAKEPSAPACPACLGGVPPSAFPFDSLRF